MNEKKKTPFNLGLIIGIIGLFAGIGLLFSESWMIGIFGSIASAGIAIKSYLDRKTLNEALQQDKEER